MSGRRDDSLLLDDILDAAKRLIALGADICPGYLGLEREVNEQILWNCVVVGEASKRLSPATLARFADVGWSDMARTRDKITHHYEGSIGRSWPASSNSTCRR